ncbi:uncharacterized protein LOC110715410 [Chenopodium quinoa]|uniref:uncharacterized protein LOC110715410 n=1 Tax=Chenopodium quinoa TaxID=63459 RepID=UPI000B7875CF|nr:uncharacterized protein LOC110715410 [Chenopodium quinoa]
MADWGNIPNDIATIIAEHLLFLEDFEAFGFVCSGWRTAAKQAKFRANVDIFSPSSPKPKSVWLMLPELDDTSNQRRFYSLYNRKVRTANLPLSSNPNNSDIRLLSSHGWLLSVAEDSDNLCIVNPLSNAIINLPKFRFWNHLLGGFSYYTCYGVTLFEKFILSGNPSLSSDFTIALVLAEPYANLCCRHEIISFWRNGNHQWEPLLEDGGLDDFVNFYNDIIFYKGNFYSVDDRGIIWCYELDHSGCPHERVVADLKTQLPDDYSPYVFELNVDNGEAKSVPNLGDVAIFVGCNSSFSAKASSAHGIKHNSIYFTDDYRPAHDSGRRLKSKSRGFIEMGIFSLTDENRHQLDFVEQPHFSEYAPYMWLEDPSL